MLLQANRITYSQYARLVDVPEQRETLHIIDPDAAKQRRENRRLAKGERIEPAEFDQHDVHIAELNAFRKTESFERLPKDAKLEFELHAKIHEFLALTDAEQDALRQSIDPNAALAPNASETPGSMTAMPGGNDADAGGPGDLDLPDGGEPFLPGSGGLGQGGQDGGQLPPSGGAVPSMR